MTVSNEGIYDSGAKSLLALRDKVYDKFHKLRWYRYDSSPQVYEAFFWKGDNMKKKMTNWEELQWRGLIKDVAGDGIEDKINNEIPENILELFNYFLYHSKLYYQDYFSQQ